MSLRFALLATLFVAVAVPPSCSGGGGSSGGGGGPVTPNTPPSATATPPTGVQIMNIPISYTLTDAESDPLSIVVEYSIDGGSTWNPATAGPGGDGISGLTSSPTGVPHLFVWASRINNVALTGPVSTVQIRITPSDSAAGTAGTTGNFTVNNKVTAYRITDLRLRDPHVFTNVGGLTSCRDITDTGISMTIPPVNIPAVNQQIANLITLDSNPMDGYYDLTLLILFRPLDQADAATGRVDWAVGRRSTSTPGVSDLDPAYTPVQSTYTSAATGTVLQPGPGTKSPANYTPAILEPAGPGFSTASFEFTFNIGPAAVPLTGVQVGAEYVGTPATSLADGLIMGFLSETAANGIMISVGGTQVPLSAFLPGGTNSCVTAYSDKDTNAGVPGWWFYFNFLATEVTYTGP